QTLDSGCIKTEIEDDRSQQRQEQSFKSSQPLPTNTTSKNGKSSYNNPSERASSGQSLDNAIAGMTEEGLEASEMLLDTAIDEGLVDANVTVNLTSCSPVDQLYISTAYSEDWVGLSKQELAQAPQQDLKNFYVLAYLFIEMVGVTWSENNLWYQSFEVCEWFGNQCLFLDTLSALDLSNNKLKGQIPAILGSLPTLRVLNLDGNSISGSIPQELSSLTALNTLDLSSLQLTGTVPNQLGKLSRVGFMNLANNSLTGSIPPELFQIEALETLGLSNNALHGSIPSDIGEATELMILELGRNMLTGSLPSAISRLSRLELLNVKDNTMTGSIPTSVLQLTTLELINVVNSGLDVEQIPASACDVSAQRIILVECTESMLRNDTLPLCIVCEQNITASINT
ncbi:MAG: hypothetical protein SGILL_009839, partial [Bacillariaceae sp.]